jgi:hypothetical protein
MAVNDSVTQNLLPVQAYFDLQGNFQTFIGQNQPFYATTNPIQSGLTITNSTINSTIIGANSPSTGVFTNITTTIGQVTTSPSGNTDITNKLYVDTVAQGLGPKAACQCGTTANITLSGLQTIDGYTTLAGDRVLVKNQTLSQFNGIYIASTTTWSRAVDMDVWAEVPGAYTVILNGGQADQGWVCTASQTGTINVTAMPWVQFSTVNTYYPGTGLSLSSNTFSITNIGTAGTYGSASAVPVFVTNAQGQVTSVTNTSIAIANTQVSGLGTMSTQNANSVAITGGSINGTTIGGSTAAAITGTTITATSSFSGSGSGLTGLATGLSIGGNAATATSATTAGSVTNSITFNSSGSGGSSPVTYNGSTAPTISYNTIGAPSTTGTNASGTWGISITGNSATVTNGVYTTGSYSNPTWITSILGSIVSGAVASATSATNLSGGTAGALAYQSGVGATTFLTLGTTNYVLTAGASAPQYVAQSTLSVGSAATATSATTATNLAGGIASQIPYQSAAGTTAFIANGTSGQFLQSNGTGAPTWATPTAYATVTDDTTTNGTRYPLYANQTSGNLATEYTSSTKLQYNPSTGAFTSTSFTGAGTGLTGTASSLSIGGNAATATSATSATTSTNLAGGLAGYLPYQSAVNTTTFLAPGTNGYILTLASGLPTWAAAPATGVTITDDTSSATAYYPLFARVTSGTVTTEYTSSTKLNYTPSTGLLAATSFSGAGTGLTGTASGLSIGGTALNVTGTVAVANGGTGLTSTPTNGQVDIGNGTGFTRSTITGTASQVAVTNGSGSITLSLPSTINVNTSGNAATATSATTATNIAGGTNLQIPYQTGAGATTFIAAPTIASTYLQYNGTGFSWATVAGGGVTSVLGTAPINVSTTSGVATVSITQATTSTNGYLSSTDFNTFNNKGSGTVTSVAQSFTGGIISVSGSPITTSGTLALTVAGTSGGIPYFTSGTTWASSAALTQYGVVYGGGAGNAPVSTAAGTTGQVLVATTSAAPSWSNISSLAITSVSGTTNQITASTTTGAVTLSLPTSITTGQYIANQSISGSATQGAFAYGTLNGSDSGIFASYQTSIASYAYMALQNTSSNAAATTDIALYNDTASLGKYIDIGINSSGFTGTGNFSLANAGYIYTNGGDLALGTYSSNGIHFIINNGATDAMTINASSAIAFNGSYGTSGQILQSNGNAASPTWVTFSGGATITPTTTTGTYYIVGTTSTSGSLSTASISNTNAVSYNANTGLLSASGGFQAPSTGPFFLNATTVSANYTIPSSYNAVTAGKVTINTGITVTVSTGSRWVVV